MLAHTRGLALAGLVAVSMQPACAHRGAPRPPLPDGVEAWSLAGEPLYRPAIEPAVAADRRDELDAARRAYERAPSRVDAIVWYGRRNAYLGRYQEAIAIYSRGLETHPDSPHLLRHRGHRYITVRRPDAAVRDLERAARLIAGSEDEVEPDGLPNARNIPTSTLHSNIWYHLGLAHYLRGDFAAALAAYRSCEAVSRNPDMLVATSNWLYLTLRRLGRDAEAARILRPIRADIDIIENLSYHRLLLLYKGELSEAAVLAAAGDDLNNATVGYGVATWHLVEGRADRAHELYRRILQGPQWAAFGFLGAEADLARLEQAAN